MAVNELQGSDVLTEVSTDQIIWKTLVCEQGSKFDITTNVTVEKTKCGPIKGIDDPDWKMSGDAVLNMAPDADQVSYADVVGWINTKTKVYIRKQSPATTSPVVTTIGQAFFQQGEGYFTSVSGDYSNGAVVKFTWNFEGQGTLITTKPALDVTIAPATVAVTAPAPFTLTATVTGGSGPFTYQWKKTGVNISGATSAVYTKATTVAGTDSGTYTVVIIDDETSTDTSNSSTVTVS